MNERQTKRSIPPGNVNDNVPPRTNNENTYMTEKKNPYDKTSAKRQSAHLGRLAKSGGKPVRVDTFGDDLVFLDDLVAKGYAPSRAEAYRRALREAHGRQKKMGNLLDNV